MVFSSTIVEEEKNISYFHVGFLKDVSNTCDLWKKHINFDLPSFQLLIIDHEDV